MAFGPPVVTGYSLFFDPSFHRAGNGTEPTYNAMPRYGRANSELVVSSMLSRGGFRGMRRVMRVLNGAAPGSVATESYTRVSGAGQSPVDVGPVGVRPMEVLVVNAGNSTAAQRDYINTHIIDARFLSNPVNYPVDTSGNGSGGQLGR